MIREHSPTCRCPPQRPESARAVPAVAGMQSVEFGDVVLEHSASWCRSNPVASAPRTASGRDRDRDRHLRDGLRAERVAHLAIDQHVLTLSHEPPTSTGASGAGSRHERHHPRWRSAAAGEGQGEEADLEPALGHCGQVVNLLDNEDFLLPASEVAVPDGGAVARLTKRPADDGKGPIPAQSVGAQDFRARFRQERLCRRASCQGTGNTRRRRSRRPPGPSAA